MKSWFTDLDPQPAAAAAQATPARPAGLLFAEDFAAPRPPPRAPAPPAAAPPIAAAALEAARADAFRQGQEAERAGVAAREAEAGAQALAAIREALRQAADAGRELAELRAAQLAAWLSEALAAALPALCARHGEAEMQAVIGAVLPALIAEPEIEIAVAADVQPGVARMLSRLDPRIAARVRIAPSEAMAPGDLRIHWQDGMAMRDGAALCAAVLNILAPSGLASAIPASSPGPGAARATIRESVHVE